MSPRRGRRDPRRGVRCNILILGVSPFRRRKGVRFYFLPDLRYKSKKLAFVRYLKRNFDYIFYVSINGKPYPGKFGQAGFITFADALEWEFFRSGELPF